MENTLLRYLAQDAASTPAAGGSGGAPGLLEAHDKRFHPNGFDPSKDHCKLRDELAKGDMADLVAAEIEEETAAPAASTGSTPQDYALVMEIRDRLEPIARLLNGRAGNLPALQSSRRWPKLLDYATKPLNPQGNPNITQAQEDLNSLDSRILLKTDSDPALRKVANALRDAAEAIVVSANSNWGTPAGMVPDASEIPQGPAGTPAAAPASPVSPAPTPSATQQDYVDLHDIRHKLEKAARLLNGRAGNLPALQASHRWQTLNSIPGDTSLATRLQALSGSPDPAIAQSAAQLEAIRAQIAASGANNWADTVGMVPSESSLPPIPGQQGGSGGSGGIPSSLAGLISSLMGGGAMPAPLRPSRKSAPVNAPKPFSDGPSPYEAFLTAANAGNPAISDPNAYKTAADALTGAQATTLIEQSIVKGGYRDAIDPNDPDEKELWSEWKPSKKLSHDTLRCAAICFADLRRRFPDIPWKPNMELRCGTKPLTGGQSTHTSDWRRHTILFNCDYGNVWSGTGLGHGADNYGHPDARFPFDVLRHELGHALISGVLPNGKRMISKWHDAMSAAYGNPSDALFDFARRYVSHYAVTNKGNGPSMAECLSECFSVATSPDYKPGYLPRPVEDFIFGEMLGVKVAPQTPAP